MQPVAFALRLHATHETDSNYSRGSFNLFGICFVRRRRQTESFPCSQSCPTSTFKDEKDKISYSLGVDIGRTLQRFQLDLNETALAQGIADVLGNKPMAMTDQALQKTLQAFQQKMVQKQQEAMAKKQEEMKGVAEKNKADGKKFLDDNAKKAG